MVVNVLTPGPAEMRVTAPAGLNCPLNEGVLVPMVSLPDKTPLVETVNVIAPELVCWRGVFAGANSPL